VCLREDAHSLGRALRRMFIPFGMPKEDGLVIPMNAPREDGYSLERAQKGWFGHSFKRV